MSSEAAAVTSRIGIDLMLAAWPGAEEALDAAIAADPDFALAHTARTRMHYAYANGRAARVKVGAARDLVGRNGTVRERSHVEVFDSPPSRKDRKTGHTRPSSWNQLDPRTAAPGKRTTDPATSALLSHARKI